MATKVEQIRAFVRDHPGRTRDDIAAKTSIGKKYVADQVARLKRLGEFQEDEEGGFTWNDAGERLTGFRAAGRKARKAAKGKPGPKPRVKSIRELADKFAAERIAPVVTHAVHVESTVRALGAMIDTEEVCMSCVRSAFRIHVEALQLAGVAGAIQ